MLSILACERLFVVYKRVACHCSSSISSLSAPGYVLETWEDKSSMCLRQNEAPIPETPPRQYNDIGWPIGFHGNARLKKPNMLHYKKEIECGWISFASLGSFVVSHHCIEWPLWKHGTILVHNVELTTVMSEYVIKGLVAVCILG